MIEQLKSYNVKNDKQNIAEKNMKKLFILLIPFIINATTLEEMYLASGPGMGYDHLIILEKDSVYTGGITVTDKSVGIKGHGAHIDLNGASIEANGEAKIDIDACVITGGTNALFLKNISCAKISNCTFNGNQNAILCDKSTHTGMIEVLNTILSNNSDYGFACSPYTIIKLHYIIAYQNAAYDYAKWCPG